MQTDTFAALEAAVQKAEDLWRRSQFAAALEAYTQILLSRLASVGEGRAAFGAADLVITERLSDLAALMGNVDGADSLLAGMVALNEQAGNRYGADYSLLKRIHLALGCGRLREAYKILRNLEPSIGPINEIEFSTAGLLRWESVRHWPGTSDRDRTVLLSRLYLEMGRIRAGLGKYDQALAAFEGGLRHSGQIAPDLARQALIHLRLAQASALLEKGALADACVILEEIRADLDSARQPGLAIAWLELSGKRNLLLGEFGEAIISFRQILRVCYDNGFDRASLTAATNLAHVLTYLNQTSAAGYLLRQVRDKAYEIEETALAVRASFLLQIVEARGHSMADGVPVDRSVTEVWGMSPDISVKPDRADACNPLDLPQSDSYLAFFEDRALGFHWYLGRRAFAACENLLSQMRAAFIESDSALIHARLRTMSGLVAYYQGEFEQAEAVLIEAGAALKDMGLKPELWQVQRFLGWCGVRLGRRESDQQSLAEETRRLLSEMTESLSAENRSTFLLNKWTADEEYIAGEINELARMKAAMEDAPRLSRPWRKMLLMKRLHRLSEHVDRYKDALAKRALNQGKDSESQRWPALSLWKRLLSHPRDRATLSFLVLPDRVLVVRSGWMFLDFGVSPITRIQVRDLVRRWHEPILDFVSVSQSFDDAPDEEVSEQNQQQFLIERSEEQKIIAGTLARALQIPAFLDSLRKQVRALTIVPDDSLHGFPFAAVLHAGEFLINRYSLSIAFEAAVNPTASKADRKDALTVGVSQGTSEFPELLGTHEELEHVGSWLARHNLNERRLEDITGEGRWPTKDEIIALLPRVSLFHIACHGEFKPDRPDASGMVLVTREGQAEVLSLRELSAMDLSRLKHATLSACWSADHFILPGRWVISLPETMWRAGAESILGCLWLVNDEVAVSLMRRFYHYLDEHPRDEALRLAQLDCLLGKLPGCELYDTTNPFFWAGYNLYGSHEKLRL